MLEKCILLLLLLLLLFLYFVDYPCPPLWILLCPSLTVCRACVTGGRVFADVINNFFPIDKFPVSIAMQAPLLTKPACKLSGEPWLCRFQLYNPNKDASYFSCLTLWKRFLPGELHSRVCILKGKKSTHFHVVNCSEWSLGNNDQNSSRSRINFFRVYLEDASSISENIPFCQFQLEGIKNCNQFSRNQ